jgi:hypothetical protein
VDFASVEPIARAILYEGYLLYPYRTSSLKNRQPCSFGFLFPRSYVQAAGDIESWSMQIECLACGDDSAVLQGSLRFLQARGPDTVEREVRLPEVCLGALTVLPRNVEFSFTLDDASPLQGVVILSGDRVTPALVKVRAVIENQTPAGTIAHAMHSTQAIFGVHGGRFHSLIDPDDDARPWADACKNRGAWPVLVGDRALQNLVIAAPIILYDYPEIAPESPGNLFDGTEIDELLTLRIMTLSDAEKQTMRRHDATRALLERTESLANDQMLALHGKLRTGPASCDTADQRPGPGDRVVVRPRGRADMLDLALDGKSATIVSVEQDFEGRIYYALAVDDDPGRDLGIAGKPGHRFYFRRDELEWYK